MKTHRLESAINAAQAGKTVLIVTAHPPPHIKQLEQALGKPATHKDGNAVFTLGNGEITITDINSQYLPQSTPKHGGWIIDDIDQPPTTAQRKSILEQFRTPAKARGERGQE